MRCDQKIFANALKCEYCQTTNQHPKVKFEKSEEFPIEQVMSAQQQDAALTKCLKRPKELHTNLTTSGFVEDNFRTYKCDSCDKSFKRLSSLQAHYMRVHNSEPIKTTKQQKVASKWQPTLKLSSDSDSDSDIHFDDTDNEYSSALIDVDSKPADLNKLYETVTKLKQTPIRETVYKCRLCNKITFQKRDHLVHIIAHTGRKAHLCVLCSDVFICAASLEAHVLSEHKQVECDEEVCLHSGIYQCKDCDSFFLTTPDMKRHKRWHDVGSAHNCDVCEIGFSSANMMDKHKRIIHSKSVVNLPKRFKCFMCKESFPFQILLTSHKRRHPEFFNLLQRTTIIQRSADNRKILYTCRTCGKNTNNQTTHIDHLNVHNSNRSTPFKCHHCSKQFTAMSTLNAHIRLHIEGPQYKCEICGICYRHRKTLRKHLMKHSGQYPVKCEYCQLGFLDQNTCTEHVRRIHTGETPYRCDICGEWFTCFSMLPPHKLLKHNVNTRTKRTVDVIDERIVEKLEIEDTQISSVYY